MTTEPDRLEVMQADKDRTALALGYKDWDDATDYRLSGAEDRRRDELLLHFARHRIETNSRTGDTVEGFGASASPTVATHEPSPRGLGPSGECQLADACEGAIGPDRELDLHIGAKLLGWRWIEDEFGDSLILDFGAANHVSWPRGCEVPACIPSPTGSLETAAMLVPEGCFYEVSDHSTDQDHAGSPTAMVFKPRWMDIPKCWDRTFAATPALALCSAALRAHISGPKS